MLGSIRRFVAEPIAPVRRRLRARVDVFSRDLRMLKGSLLGKHPPPFRERHATATELTLQAAASPRVVRVSAVTRETADCVSLVIEDVCGAPFAFSAGQFFTVIVHIDGVAYRRAYSASSAANVTDKVTISVKRVHGGLVSNFIHERVVVGTEFAVLGPSGDFVVPPLESEASRTLVMIAGGSGITPIASIIRTELASGDRTKLILVYGSRSSTDIIFGRELSALACAYPDRFRVVHVLGEANERVTPHAGVLDREGLSAVLDRERIGLESIDRCYVCGPEPMMDGVRDSLVARGMPVGNITFERFLAPRAPSFDARADEPHTVTLRHKGRSLDLVAMPGQTLLEAALAAGEALPFSCTMGGCGACKVKRLAGSVAMAEPNCLTETERREGAVLACVACVLSDLEVEVG